MNDIMIDVNSDEILKKIFVSGEVGICEIVETLDDYDWELMRKDEKIKKLKEENKELKNCIRQLMNNEIPTRESLILSRIYNDKEAVTYDELLDVLEELAMEKDYFKNKLEDIKKLGGDYEI